MLVTKRIFVVRLNEAGVKRILEAGKEAAKDGYYSHSGDETKTVDDYIINAITNVCENDGISVQVTTLQEKQ